MVSEQWLKENGYKANILTEDIDGNRQKDQYEYKREGLIVRVNKDVMTVWVFVDDCKHGEWRKKATGVKSRLDLELLQRFFFSPEETPLVDTCCIRSDLRRSKSQWID